LASINAASSETERPEHLIYTAGSAAAHKMFSVMLPKEEKARLTGCNMLQFLEGVKKRMHPWQWKAFERDQENARKNLRVRITDKNGKQSVAAVPIVFQSHENEEYNNRAYLPIIVQDYRDGEGEDNWYSLRVLYLNVTSVAEKVVENGEEFYICRLDPATEERLKPLPIRSSPNSSAGVQRMSTITDHDVRSPNAQGGEPLGFRLKHNSPVRLFISYTRKDVAIVERIYKKLRGFRPSVNPFWDLDIPPASDYTEALEAQAMGADMWLVFLRRGAMGPGMDVELRVLKGLIMSRKRRNMPVLPVLLDPKAKLPPFLSTFEAIGIDKLDNRCLQEIICARFPERCPEGWRNLASHANQPPSRSVSQRYPL
jgi:hypothetical protein